MTKIDSKYHEWWQATIVLGNFDSELEAIGAIAQFQGREDFVEGHTKRFA